MPVVPTCSGMLRFFLLVYHAFLEKLGIMFGSYLPKFHVIIGLVLSLFYMFALNNLSI